MLHAGLQVKMVGDRSPLPGLSKDKVAFETDEDPLGLSQGGWIPYYDTIL